MVDHEDKALPEGMEMVAMQIRVVGIFVDKACPERWIARDSEGNFWMVPPVELRSRRREQSSARCLAGRQLVERTIEVYQARS